ncbi:MAG: cysteine desulfuration protein sufE [Chlamydiota bacterium]|jgi:cysteine desulfuration protein SufE
MDNSSFMAKQAHLKALFADCDTQDKIYLKIIELGKALPSFPEEQKLPHNLVKGCQSQMYLTVSVDKGKLQFRAYSDALISAGLAALLLALYNDEPPEVILSCPPTLLTDLNLQKSLSPGRSNGLASLFNKMKLYATILKNG